MNSAEKTVTLLKILARKPYVYGVTELGEKIGCGKSGTFKLLNVLVQEGLAAQTPEHKYTLGMVSYLLGKCYEDHVGVVRFVRPYLERLRDLTGETATFGMLVNGVPTSICREEGTHMVRVMGHLGGTRPLNAGAIGKMLGAYMGEADLRRHLLETPAHAYTERTLTDPEAIARRQWIVDNYDPYLDGHVCERMLNAAADYIRRHGVPAKRRLNLWRKYTSIKTFGRIKKG